MTTLDFYGKISERRRESMEKLEAGILGTGSSTALEA
jgi:hypothetical protein